MDEVEKYIRDIKSNVFKDKAIAIESLMKLAGKTDCSRAVPVLIESLNDEHLSIRSMARKTLIKIGEPALPYLLKAMNNSNSNIRYGVSSILHALAEKGIDCSAAVPALKEALKDKDEYVQLASQRALNEIYAKQMCARPNEDKKFPEKERSAKAQKKDKLKL